MVHVIQRKIQSHMVQHWLVSLLLKITAVAQRGMQRRRGRASCHQQEEEYLCGEAFPHGQHTDRKLFTVGKQAGTFKGNRDGSGKQKSEHDASIVQRTKNRHRELFATLHDRGWSELYYSATIRT